VKRDYYEILGVGREASAEELRRAYRQLAMRHHPDRNPGDPDAEARFKEATEAWEVLRDPERRAAYDRFGHAGLSGSAGGGRAYDLSEALAAFMRDFGAFGGLEDLFGGGRPRGGPRRGGDVQVRVRLTLAEVATGVERTLPIVILDPCDECGGTGSETRRRDRCPDCGGAGELRQSRRSIFGQFVSVVACPRCGGEGTVVERACPVCGGEGRRRREKRVKVKIPAGVSTGNYLTLRGQGNAGANGGPRGHVIVLVEVLEHELLRRDGDDVLLEHVVSFPEAALGATVSVPGLDGPVQVAIPPGTQSGAVLAVRGRGIPRLGGKGRGDLRVHVRVWTPTRVSPADRRLLEELAVSEAVRPPESERGGFWGKVKEALGA
jgi:molecular chaperone DnaJ